MPRPLLLLLGDSITQFGSDWRRDGWICLLMDRFSRSVDIAQRGMGAYSTQSFMNLVVSTLANDLATSLHPQLITLWLGANDAALLNGPSWTQHVPLPMYKTNLHTMLDLFKEKAPQAKVLLITPPAVDDDRRHDTGGQDRTNAMTGEYATACVEVAREAGVEVLDLHTIFNALPMFQWKDMLLDGLHLNSLGNHFVEQQLVTVIRTKFPDLQRQLEQLEFPYDWLATRPPSQPFMMHSRVSETAMKLEASPSSTEDLLGINTSAAPSIGLACVVLVGVVVVLVKRIVRAKPIRAVVEEDTKLLRSTKKTESGMIRLEPYCVAVANTGPGMETGN